MPCLDDSKPLDGQNLKGKCTRVTLNFFDHHSLSQYRDALYWWYIVAIDFTNADDSRGSDYVYKLHKHLQKVIEAAHLIHIRA